jgi:hypothetical protein
MIWLAVIDPIDRQQEIIKYLPMYSKHNNKWYKVSLGIEKSDAASAKENGQNRSTDIPRDEI